MPARVANERAVVQLRLRLLALSLFLVRVDRDVDQIVPRLEARFDDVQPHGDGAEARDSALADVRVHAPVVEELELHVRVGRRLQAEVDVPAVCGGGVDRAVPVGVALDMPEVGHRGRRGRGRRGRGPLALVQVHVREVVAHLVRPIASAILVPVAQLPSVVLPPAADRVVRGQRARVEVPACNFLHPRGVVPQVDERERLAVEPGGPAEGLVSVGEVHALALRVRAVHRVCGRSGRLQIHAAQRVEGGRVPVAQLPFDVLAPAFDPSDGVGCPGRGDHRAAMGFPTRQRLRDEAAVQRPKRDGRVVDPSRFIPPVGRGHVEGPPTEHGTIVAQHARGRVRGADRGGQAPVRWYPEDVGQCVPHAGRGPAPMAAGIEPGIAT